MSMWPNFQLGFLSSRGLHCWLINEPYGLSFNKVGWLGLGLLQGTHCIVSVDSPLSGLRIERRFFFLLDSLFFEESFVKVSDFFLNRLDQLGTGSIGPARQPRLINMLYCFGRFSLIRGRN